MAETPMSWIAAALGLARLVETESGVVVVGANGSPEPEALGELPGSLETHVLRLVGEILPGIEVSASVGELLAQARAGQRDSIQLGPAPGVRVLAAPWRGSMVEVVIAGRAPAIPAEVQRRAAVSDMASAVSHEV